MPRLLGLFAALVAAALVTQASLAPVAPLLAQSALAPLGLTDAQARTFLFDELKGQTTGRRTRIAVTGHRAFYKLPAAARGPAATALFAWARAYVGSAAFKTAYAQYRQDANPLDTRASKAVDQQVADQLAEALASIEQARTMAATLPPADRDRFLAQVKAQEDQIRDPAWAARLRAGLEMEQSSRTASNEASGRAFEEQFPADPNQLVARRLRGFLDETADADFSARIIRLTDGPDGMEFVEPRHRAKSSTWQLAVLAGPEATKAARAAAESWLKEIAP